MAIIVQARTSSSRMPGKVLAHLAGAPALTRMVERLARVRNAEWIIIATSEDASDDAIEELCRASGTACVRGALDDVLARFADAIPSGCDTIVRLTGDCPLVDPELVDHHIELYARNQPTVDYVSNAVVRTQPDGLDVEVFSADLLIEAARTATSQRDREHVTPWIQRRARQLPVAQDVDLSELRWTLDTPEDYEKIAAIYDRLYERSPQFARRDVYRLLLEEPALIHVGRALEPAERARWQAQIRAHLSCEVMGQ